MVRPVVFVVVSRLINDCGRLRRAISNSTSTREDTVLRKWWRCLDTHKLERRPCRCIPCTFNYRTGRIPEPNELASYPNRPSRWPKEFTSIPEPDLYRWTHLHRIPIRTFCRICSRCVNPSMLGLGSVYLSTASAKREK
ncbi:hypothetical protein C8Q70DRAFT_942924 [Cubamyces menziesii]|nr:hypothetical protein C8Q70DRAFT_942924 [Cubamyces menziesii]